MSKKRKGRPHAKGEHAERKRRLVELLECPICLKPASSPQLLGCCGNLICALCMHGCLHRKDECPLCRQLSPPLSDHRFAQNVRQTLQETGADLPLGGMWIDGLGRKLEGEFKDGKLHGQGMYKNGKLGIILEGEFKDGKLLKGKVTSNGGILEGGFKDGKLHGQVKITGANGTIVEGGFKDGKLHGQGKRTSANGVTVTVMQVGKRVYSRDEICKRSAELTAERAALSALIDLAEEE